MEKDSAGKASTGLGDVAGRRGGDAENENRGTRLDAAWPGLSADRQR